MDDREFLRRHGRYRGINDFFPLADVGRNLGELEPSHGPVYLVTDTPTFWVSNISRKGTECREKAINRVSTRTGAVGPGMIVPYGGFQEYNRDAYIEQLLEEGRIRKCGSYRNNMLDYDHWFVKEFESQRRKANRSPEEAKNAPRSLADMFAIVFSGGGHTPRVGDRVYRVLADRLTVGCSGGMARRGDEIVSSMISRLDPEGSARSAIKGGIIEEVGVISEANSWNSTATVEYLRGREPKEEN